LKQYVKHNDNKFDYDNQGIAHRKHIIVNRIRHIGKESNNLDEAWSAPLNSETKLSYSVRYILNGELKGVWGEQ